MNARSLVVLASTCLVSTGAWASGITFGENGTRALSMGGAFAGQADDLSAIQHNPAGLTQIQGLEFLASGDLINNDVTFQRTEPNGSGQPGPANPISNQGGLFFLPEAAVGYGLPFMGHAITAALGIYGPPSDGRYTYPAPDYTQKPDGTYVNDPRHAAPERYALVSNNVFIAYPTLSLAVALHPRFSLGASFQYIYSTFEFHQTVYSGLFTPTSQATELPAYDSTIDLAMKGNGGFTGILGAWFRPDDHLSFGLSVRPPTHIAAAGTLNVNLGAAAQSIGAKVNGNDAALGLTFPLEIKLGAHLAFTRAFAVNVDGVYEGWQSFDYLTVTPENITTQFGNGPATALSPIQIPKHYHHTLGVRAGASYRFPFGLGLRAGVLWEEAAAPEQYTSVDFPHQTRAFVTVGAGYEIGPVEIDVVGAFTPDQTLTVTDSAVRQANTDPTIQGSVVGNGSYTSGGWILGAGLRGHFGGPERNP